MTGQIQEEVFEVRLPNLDLVQIADVRPELLQRLADVSRNNLNNAQLLVYRMLDAGQAVGEVGNR